jgi:hypothetical protein
VTLYAVVHTDERHCGHALPAGCTHWTTEEPA